MILDNRTVASRASATVAKRKMSKGYMYILECADGSYYTGSTKNLEKRLWEHQNMLGANYTKRRLPVKLVYYEEYQRIDEAFYREKQVQGWSRKKKEALINGKPELLPKLAIAYRDLQNESSVASRTSATDSKLPWNFLANNDKSSSDTEAPEKSEDTELVEVSDSTLASSASANVSNSEVLEKREVSEVLEETSPSVVSKTSTTDYRKSHKNNKNIKQ